VEFSHISCGSDVVWACDTNGSVYLAVVSPHAMATATLAPVWIQVDSKEQSKIVFVKVRMLAVVKRLVLVRFFLSGI